MPKLTLFELKEKMATMQAAINADAEWIAEKAADPTTPMKEIEEKTAHRDELAKRFELLKKEHDSLEAEQKAALVKQHGSSGMVDEKTSKVKAKADFYRAVLNGGDVRKTYAGLGAIPAGDNDLGNGERLLPTNMERELITEPMVENPMRDIVRMSNITGLEEPKLAFELDGAYDDVTDKATAKEIELEGDTVTYGRHKVKVKAKVFDTVIHGSDLGLVTEIENALRSGLSVNEMARMFAETPGTGYEGMSFYSTQNAVKTVEGASLQTAIADALADLPIGFRRNASIVMSAVDWFNVWKDNLNQSGTFYEDRPMTMFGKPVILVDEAIKPIVGDFSYARINYDIGALYDTDKDVDSGVYKFVLTAWYDIKLRLKSAFRIAKVKQDP